MGLGSPGGDLYTDTAKLCLFTLSVLVCLKNETVTTKSLSSNDYFNLSSIVMHRTNRVALCKKWVWGPQGGFIYRYSEIMHFHSICPRVFKNETVTTKSLNSNDYFNLSIIVVHRNNKVALRNKWVWGTQWE